MDLLYNYITLTLSSQICVTILSYTASLSTNLSWIIVKKTTRLELLGKFQGYEQQIQDGPIYHKLLSQNHHKRLCLFISSTQISDNLSTQL